MNSTDLENLTPEQLRTIDFYSANEMHELKRICYPLICRKGVPTGDHDDLYSLASYTLLESIVDYDESKQCSFRTYLTGNIQRSFYDWSRNGWRGKRCNVERDENGRIKREKNEKGKVSKPIIIPDVSLDAKAEEGVDLLEKIDSGFQIEDYLSGKIGISSSSKVEKFMQSLSNLQRNILKMKMDGISVDAIKEKLNISYSEYKDAMISIKENKLICMFNKNPTNNVRNKRENKKVERTILNSDDLIMDLDTTDNHTTEVRSVEALLRDKSDGELDCEYISQRDPLQWSDNQTNKFLSRVLNNQPIPEIVICETDKAIYGEKISYLVEGLQRISYAEEFRENRIPVKANGAEFVKIKYKKFEYDSDNRIVKDENGRAKYTIDIFDITGKYYRDLPEYLQKRFDNYNISITRYFNCTYALIDYHIRNYNNHEGMTKSHYGITSVSNDTSTKIKSISRKHPFFINNVKYTNKAKKRGVLEEMVARSIMSTFFLDDWKKESIEALKHVDHNMTDEQFEHFKENLDRLAKVADEHVTDMFNSTNIYIWLAVFDKFTEYDIDDIKFIDFMKKFSEELHSVKVNGRSYDDVNSRNTRDKSTVKNKISVLIDLMKEYLKITDADKNVVENIEAFVSECVGMELEEIHEDLGFYNQSLDELLEATVRLDSKLRYDENRPSLLAMMVYSYKEDVDLEGWLMEYASNTTSYIRNQKENFLHMIDDLKKFIQRTERSA